MLAKYSTTEPSMLQSIVLTVYIIQPVRVEIRGEKMGGKSISKRIQLSPKWSFSDKSAAIVQDWCRIDAHRLFVFAKNGMMSSFPYIRVTNQHPRYMASSLLGFYHLMQPQKQKFTLYFSVDKTNKSNTSLSGQIKTSKLVGAVQKKLNRMRETR